ncbi:MAG: tetratricopeptide repeat protein [Candidatus Aminicenantaceae bacterium]
MNTSKHIFSIIIFASLCLVSLGVLPQKTNAAQSKAEQLIKAGKELYETGEYKEAIIQFLEALTEARSDKDFTEIYFNLSLAYYADGQADKAKNYLKKLFGIEPERAIDERYFPLGYVGIFNRAKQEAKIEREEKRKKEEEAKAQETGTGWLVIKAFPYAEIEIDGRIIREVPPPLKVGLKVGKHTITFVATRLNKRHAMEVTVAKGETKEINHKFE